MQKPEKIEEQVKHLKEEILKIESEKAAFQIDITNLNAKKEHLLKEKALKLSYREDIEDIEAEIKEINKDIENCKLAISGCNLRIEEINPEITKLEQEIQNHKVKVIKDKLSKIVEDYNKQASILAELQKEFFSYKSILEDSLGIKSNYSWNRLKTGSIEVINAIGSIYDKIPVFFEGLSFRKSELRDRKRDILQELDIFI